jgi:predicted histone-like DNA-binding protein
MAIKYSVQQKSQAGIKGGGHRKFYASVVNSGEVTIDDMVRDIQEICALSEPNIRAIVSAFETVIKSKLTDSLVVRFEQLGAFYPALSSEGKDTEEEVSERCIRKVGINYRPDSRIIRAMVQAGCEKVIVVKKKKKNKD